MPSLDTHCHLDDPRFVPDLGAVLERAAITGVKDIVAPASEERRWPALYALAGRGGWPRVHPAFGVHPWYLREDDNPHSLTERLSCVLDAAGHRAVAVGEVGLDFWPGMPEHGVQERLLRAQLELAQARDLPVILHARRSEDRLAKCLRDYPGLRGVVHGFTGSEQQAERFVGLGLLLGVGGVVTRQSADRLRRVFAAVPVDRVLIESDAPDQAPSAHAGQRNEPAFMGETLAVLAKDRAMDALALAALLDDNARRLFRIDGGAP